MSKSLAELRASSHASLPERSYPLCLAQGLVAQGQSLEDERSDLAVERAKLAVGSESGGDDGTPRVPRRLSEGNPPRVAEIDARLAEIDAELEALWADMREHTGELRLRAIPAGEWRRWVDAHPAREDNKVDESVVYGICDADALMDDLAHYVVSHNGEALAEGDWEFVANRAAPGDLAELCKIVVQMHETAGVHAPKGSRTGSSATSPNVSA